LPNRFQAGVIRSGLFHAMPTKSAVRIYRGTPRNLAMLARRLRAGELVAVPTETVYGLAANAFDAAACRNIFVAKGRPARDPLIVHIFAMRDLDLVADANAAALKLARRFWPGPLTLVLPRKRAVPAVVSAGLPSVAVRMPAHPLLRRLLRLAGMPLAAPSANPFGYISPTTAEHVRHGLAGKISHILDGGAARVGLESTIVDVRDPKRPRLLRPGAITLAELERTLGRKIARRRGDTGTGKKNAVLLAPGLMARHYSPRTPVALHESISATEARHPDEAWVLIAKPARRSGANVFWLDPRGNLRGVARRLFATLRRLDDGRFKKINVELAHGHGLADAINDRLRRASAR
jgi:L-threonylcarbamoyladenylate synthase